MKFGEIRNLRGFYLQEYLPQKFLKGTREARK